MKNTYLTISIMIFLISGSSYAQRGDLVLMFSAKDIETNIPVPLESVFINNITKGCDTTLYGETPYLYLEWPSGIYDNNINNNNNPFSLQPNYPNPFSVTTNVKISVTGKEKLRFILYDINGIAKSEFEKELNNGIHTFEIGVGKSKICFLLVSNSKVTKSIKLVSNVTESLSNQGITYIGRDNIGYKSTEVIESFEFYPGDQLLMKASASGYYDSTLYDYPNENTNYIFELQNETIISFPTVTTSGLTDITQNSATSGGNVTDDGGEDVTARGVCWSISQNPTISNNHTIDGSGTGTFTSYLTSLPENTTYYVRAYATNSVGTSYGNQISFTTGTITTPSVTTNPVTDTTQYSATSGGNVTYDGGADITARGACCSTSQNPTISDNHTVDGSGTGAFTSYLTSLSQNTTYYVRAYATNSVGTAYGNEISFTTWSDPCGGLTTVSYEGQTYNIVSIGNQCWMSENLNYETTNSWWYDNSSTNGDIYGRLYTWEAALTACPSGWSLPSDDEWKTMEMTLGMSQSQANGYGYRGTGEGEKMKSISGWKYNENGTNSSGFNGFPGGYQDINGTSQGLTSAGYWWSSSEQSDESIWFRQLYLGDQVYRAEANKTHGFSIRCLKN